MLCTLILAFVFVHLRIQGGSMHLNGDMRLKHTHTLFYPELIPPPFLKWLDPPQLFSTGRCCYTAYTRRYHQLINQCLFTNMMINKIPYFNPLFINLKVIQNSLNTIDLVRELFSQALSIVKLLEHSSIHTIFALKCWELSVPTEGNSRPFLTHLISQV